MAKSSDRKLAERQLEVLLENDCPQYAQDRMPFFVVGCVRSGTTLLRDMLRGHPRLECPEETHFFRWAAPMGTAGFNGHYRTELLRKHREIDGVDHGLFNLALNLASSREHLAYQYGQWYLEKTGNPEARLFDKTPQNVYGMFLINAVYPSAKFVCIHRNPLNVVASLLQGRVMGEQNILGAYNYWVESMLLIDQFREFRPGLLFELKYEDLVTDPDRHLRDILTFLGEDPSLLPSQAGVAHREKNKYRKVLDRNQIDLVVKRCEPWFSRLGYAVGKSRRGRSRSPGSKQR
ncbi:MAG: sulfotransferase [Halioglobus sp.]|nr:sulfotransferase [Halioglobus sp.]